MNLCPADLLDAAALAVIVGMLAYRVNRLEANVMALRVMAAASHVHDDAAEPYDQAGDG